MAYANCVLRVGSGGTANGFTFNLSKLCFLGLKKVDRFLAVFVAIVIYILTPLTNSGVGFILGGRSLTKTRPTSCDIYLMQ